MARPGSGSGLGARAPDGAGRKVVLHGGGQF